VVRRELRTFEEYPYFDSEVVHLRRQEYAELILSLDPIFQIVSVLATASFEEFVRPKTYRVKQPIHFSAIRADLISLRGIRSIAIVLAFIENLQLLTSSCAAPFLSSILQMHNTGQGARRTIAYA
jgi:hypothetical protein